MVIRERTVHLKKKLCGFHVEPLEDPMHNRTRSSVPAIHYNGDLALEFELLRDLVNVGSDCIHLLHASLPALKVRSGNQLVDFLDRLAMQRSCPAYGFEAVIFRWIVAPRDHDGAVGLEVNRRIVQNRCRYNADIQHCATTCQKTSQQSAVKA